MNQNPFDRINIENASDKDLDVIEGALNKCSTILDKALNRIKRYYLNRSVRNKSKHLRKKYRKSRTVRGFYRSDRKVKHTIVFDLYGRIDSERL